MRFHQAQAVFADEKSRPTHTSPARTMKPSNNDQSSGNATSRKHRKSQVSRPRLIMITNGLPSPLRSVRSASEYIKPISSPPSMIPAKPYLKYQEPTSP